jgi:hypothetical protein
MFMSVWLSTFATTLHFGIAYCETIRFVVAEVEPFHGDSYVLPLSDPSAIAHARQLIAQGRDAGPSIVSAKIAKGANGINRDVLAGGAPVWSWHVTEFEGFYDNTIEILDGWPTYVEGDVDGWIANTNGGYIGFWTYTVTAELRQGDYDFDLDVDAADYVVWRDGFGGMNDLSADGDGSGVVDAADYAVWRANFGKSITLPPRELSSVTVPEPSTVFATLILAGFGHMGMRARRLAH